MLKNTPANAGDMGDMGLIPRSGRSPGKEMATRSNILAWRIPWTEEPGGLQSMGSQRVGRNGAPHINRDQQAAIALPNPKGRESP